MNIASIARQANFKAPQFHYEPKVGQSFLHAAEQALKISQRNQANIAMSFGEVPLVITPSCTLDKLRESYQTAKNAFPKLKGGLNLPLINKLQQWVRILV